jgi:LPS export ABC transporter permease LptF
VHGEAILERAHVAERAVPVKMRPRLPSRCGCGQGGSVRLIDRYIGRQLLVSALFAVVVLSVVLVLGNVFKKLLDMLVNQNAPASFILSFIAYVLPFSLTFTIPWGFLTAVLLVFGRMSAENELTALRSNGVSIPRVCAPVWAMALALTGVCLWINLDVAPRAQVEMKNAIFNIATSNPMAMFGSDRVIEDFGNEKIYVEKVLPSAEGNQLAGIHIYSLDSVDGSLKAVIFARRGILALNGDRSALTLTYHDGRYEQRDEKYKDSILHWKPGITIGTGSIEISLKELYERKQKLGGVGTMAMDELLKTDEADAKVELNKRFSNALATLAFALLAIPLAITAQRKETSVGFAISLAIGLTYYLFFFLADMARGRPNWHPELLVWLPNVLFMSIGAFRFFRLSKR